MTITTYVFSSDLLQFYECFQFCWENKFLIITMQSAILPLKGSNRLQIRLRCTR